MATKSATAPAAAPRKNSLLADFFKSLVAATDPVVLKEIATDAAVRKAMETDGAAGDDGDVRILDQQIGAMRDVVPPAGQVNLGPPQVASGEGAERMIREYSKPDPQQDIVARYEELSRELGSLRAYTKAMAESNKAIADAFAAILKKAEEDEEGEQTIDIAVEENEEDEEGAKSLPAAYRNLIGEMTAALLQKAEDEDDEDEEQTIEMGSEEAEEDETGKSINPLTRVFLAKAIWFAAKAALATPAPKMRKAARRRLSKVVEAALQRAWALLRKAEEEAEKEDEGETKKALRRTIRKASERLAEYAYVRGINLRKAKKAKAAPAAAKAESAEADLGKNLPETNQTTWTESEGEGGKPGPVMKSELEKVLAGQAMLNASVQGLLKVVAGTSRPQDLTVTELVKGAAVTAEPQTPPNPLVLAKGADISTIVLAKAKAIQDAVATDQLTLNEELAAEAILRTAEAVAAGACDIGTLQGRIRTSEGTVRAIFADMVAE